LRYLDAEDSYDLMQAFHALCVERVAPYAGHVLQPSNDGLVVYFGYPQAHDDAAQRAVHSGLAIAEAVRRGALEVWALPGMPQAVRVGIATGMMIVSAENAPALAPAVGVGSVSSLAPRLAALAPPGGVVISEATMRLVSGYFECKALEDVRLADEAVADEVEHFAAIGDFDSAQPGICYGDCSGGARRESAFIRHSVRGRVVGRRRFAERDVEVLLPLALHARQQDPVLRPLRTSH